MFTEEELKAKLQEMAKEGSIRNIGGWGNQAKWVLSRDADVMD